MLFRTICRPILSAVAMLALALPVAAQTPAGARLLVTVTDPSGGVLPGAVVKITGQPDAAGAKPVAAAAATSDKGLATFEALGIGKYTITAEFSGFELGTLKDLRIRVGDNKHVVILPIKKQLDEVTVSQDRQLMAADRRSGSFGSVLTREEINALSDDPTEMAQQLIEMAGGNAVIRVDSFLGGPLPPKALIKSIHVVRDTFAAENHSAESDEIQIITQPGVGPVHGGLNSRVRDSSMSGRNVLTDSKVPERSQNYEGNFDGALIQKKASFSLSGSSRRAFDKPVIFVNNPGGGTTSTVLDLRRPNNSWSTYDLLDFALTTDQIVRMSYDHNSTTRENLGVGAYDLAERAYRTTSGSHEFRIQETGPLGRRSFIATRLQVQWTDSTSSSSIEAPTIRVTDARTSGGAQVKGGRHVRDFEFASDLDYVRGIHSMRAGVSLEGGNYRSDDSQNYLGTYLFTSPAAFAAGTPATFTKRIGDPNISYFNMNSGVYVQDDIRVSKQLTFSPGIRYEFQTHVSEHNAFAPRFGVTWAPLKSGKTTLRASLGKFYNWLSTGNYEQTLRVDGFRQQDIIITNPGYPALGTGGTTFPGNRYLLGDDLQLVHSVRMSLGIDQTISSRVRASATFSHNRFGGMLRGSNLNAPVNGVRPNTTFANVIATVADGRQHVTQLQTNLNINLAPKDRAAQQMRFNWQRASVRVTYTLMKAENDFDGAFVVPPSGTLATEWAPSSADRRHRATVTLTSQALKNLNAALTFTGNTGNPYTITTGLDNNGDLIYNDRPAGVGRNTVRTPSQYTLGLNLSYAVNVGPRAAPTDAGQAPGNGKYRLNFTLAITNLTNHSNYGGFSGVMTSPYFRTATNVQGPRKIDLGMNISF